MEKFNDTIKNEEGCGLRKLTNPYFRKNFRINDFEEDNNCNNENINENINSNLSVKEEKEQNINLSYKNIDFNSFENNDNFYLNDKNKIILQSQILIPKIIKIYKKSKKYDYNFDTINIDFNDFINNCSFENKENNNTINFSNNIINNTNANSNKEKCINDSFSNLSQTIKSEKNDICNNNIYLGKYMIIENGKKKINKNLIKCNCKNSSCLKFYCECFANGKCCENCFCCNCKNKIEYENLRQEKYKKILSRNPKAIYQINSIKKSWTCNCKNSNCKKKYCDCYQNGRTCTTKCKCVNCLNKISNTNNNNSGKSRKIKRLRGGKKIIKNNKYITPKKKNNTNHKNIYNNQSTDDLTENNNKNNVFNNVSNKIKYKDICQKLDMNGI